MTRSQYHRFPAGLIHAIRQASVPPYLQALFTRLGADIDLDAELPSGNVEIPAGALALLKLASQGTFLRLGNVTLSDPPRPLSMQLSRAGRHLPLAEDDFATASYASNLVREIARVLLEPEAAAKALERFARESPRQEALRQLTREMLDAHSMDRLQYITLLGITSGAALGFNRAALFVFDETDGVFRGERGIGPNDEEEAHRIWESIEFEDKTFEDLIDDYTRNRVDTRFEQFVRTLELEIGNSPEDEVLLAIQNEGPVRLSRSPVESPGLRSLNPHHDFILCPLQSRGQVLGLVFADNVFSRTPVDDETLSFLSFLLDATALVWENLRLLENVDRLARHDALTGLFNRREFESRFQAEQSRAERKGAPCSLLLVDVDWFKQINDEAGHKAGDDVLRLLGRWLQGTLRQHDVAARYGGDEFILLLPETGPSELRAVAERIGGMARQNGVSVSMGAATWPTDCSSFDDLLNRADEGLYRAKNCGRGRAAFYHEPFFVEF